jgi:hypothetical protein
MNTKLIAALLLSSAVFATPAFAGNAHSDDDVTALAASSGSTLSRAQVRADLIASQQANGRQASDETTYPVQARNDGQESRRAVEQRINVVSGSMRNIFAFGHDAS